MSDLRDILNDVVDAGVAVDATVMVDSVAAGTEATSSNDGGETKSPPQQEETVRQSLAALALFTLSQLPLQQPAQLPEQIVPQLPLGKVPRASVPSLQSMPPRPPAELSASARVRRHADISNAASDHAFHLKQARHSALDASPRSVDHDDMMHIEDNLSLSSRSASSQLSAMNLSGISTPRDDFLALSPAAVQFDQTLEQQHQHQQLQQLQQSQQQSQQQPQQQFLPSQHALVQVAHAQFSAATPSLTTPLQIALLKAEASGASNTSSIAALGISPHRFMSDSAFVARPSTVLPTSVGDFDASSPHRHFELVRQPKPKQRKSYRTENRYLAPNPFTVRYRGRPTSDHARPRAGGVAVSLMDVLGRPLDIAVQKELVGGQRKMLSIGSTTAVASFSLKMHVTSRGEELRLAFDIDWIGADGLQRRERVLSDAFRVNTNIRRPKAGANDRSASDDDAS